ncbi:MAG: GGDEF domain-containing protein [Opitutaceae bacterium]|nr:GGDEF domain-containing protein [Opitutaceae bacterium]
MRAPGITGDMYLHKLAELGAGLAQSTPGSAEFFAAPLTIVHEAMGFTLSVIYRVEARVDRTLVLEVAGVLDPGARRPELLRGARLAIALDQPDPVFGNEAQAFLHHHVSALNVPGMGCDIASYVAAGETAADAYLLAGDFVGAEAGLQPVDVRLFEIATGMLSALLTKAHFQRRADHDRLTGLMSAARIRSELDDWWQRGARRPDRGRAVVIADVDDFKLINDRHGHPTGDAVLKELGRLLAAILRSERDFAGRYGGDEFLILLDETTADEARVIVERLCRTVEQHSFRPAAADGGRTSDAVVPVTISVGACVLESGEPVNAAAEALASADQALYAAKRAGRNRGVVAG